MSCVFAKLRRMQGGSARTLLVINCSPCADNAAETLSSLRFGSRALGVKNTVAVNRRLSPEALQQQLAQARAEVGVPAGVGWRRHARQSSTVLARQVGGPVLLLQRPPAGCPCR
jgi:hypothetical protein